MRIFVTGLVLLSSVGVAQADCICLNRGLEVSEGKTACIQTSQGGKLALCEKNLNVTNWKFLGEECPVAGRLNLHANEARSQVAWKLANKKSKVLTSNNLSDASIP